MSEQPPYDDASMPGGGYPPPAPAYPPPGSAYPVGPPPAPPGWGMTILPAGDVIGDGPARPARRRTGILVGAIATAIGLVAGAGAYAAMQLGGGGRQPESLAPATTFAFVKLDLDPPAGQKIAVRDLLRKFPEAPQGEMDEVVHDFLRKAMQQEDINFDRDIEPWFGDRIGIAGFTDAAGRAKGLGIVQSKDDEAAKAALARLSTGSDPIAFEVRDGYVLISEVMADVHSATAALRSGSLDDDSSYAEDVAELDGDQIMTAWADLGRGFDAAKSLLGAEAVDLPASVRDQLQGRIALGVHAESDAVEVEGISIGGATAPSTGGRSTLLTDLPVSTVAVVSAAGLGDTVSTQVDEAIDAFSSTIPGGAGGLTRDDINRELEEAVGLNLDEDLLPLLGDQLMLVLGEVPDFTSETVPDVALMSVVSDPARAARTVRKIQALTSEQGLPLSAKLDGDTFVIGTSDEYVGELSGTGQKLVGSAKFQNAVGDLGDDGFVMYADLAKLLVLVEDESDYRQVKPLSAVGIRGGVRNGRGYFRLRLVVE